jgi:predicted nicotinamide N-methyase
LFEGIEKLLGAAPSVASITFLSSDVQRMASAEKQRQAREAEEEERERRARELTRQRNASECLKTTQNSNPLFWAICRQAGLPVAGGR